MGYQKIEGKIIQKTLKKWKFKEINVFSDVEEQKRHQGTDFGKKSSFGRVSSLF